MRLRKREREKASRAAGSGSHSGQTISQASSVLWYINHDDDVLSNSSQVVCPTPGECRVAWCDGDNLMHCFVLLSWSLTDHYMLKHTVVPWTSRAVCPPTHCLKVDCRPLDSAGDKAFCMLLVHPFSGLSIVRFKYNFHPLLLRCWK